MKTFKINAREYLFTTREVNASSKKEAEEKMNAMQNNEEGADKFLKKVKSDTDMIDWFVEDEPKVAYNGMGGVKDDYMLTMKFNFNNRNNMVRFNKKLRAMKDLRKWSAENDEGFVPDWDNDTQDKYELLYDIEKGKWTTSAIYMIGNFYLPYFSSKEIGMKCIEECADALFNFVIPSVTHNNGSIPHVIGL